MVVHGPFRYISNVLTVTGAGYASDATLQHDLGINGLEYWIVVAASGGNGGALVKGTTTWDSNHAYFRGESGIVYSLVLAK